MGSLVLKGRTVRALAHLCLDSGDEPIRLIGSCSDKGLVVQSGPRRGSVPRH